MIQIFIRWEDTPEDKALYERLTKGFDKIGCWRAELPPESSIYRTMLTLEAHKEGKDGKKEKE